MLKCRDFSELASDYMEGDLAPRAWLAVRWHLMLCGMCRNYLDQLRKTTRLLHGGTLPPPDAAAEARLLAAVPRPPSPP